jgi:hypothetical protein
MNRSFLKGCAVGAVCVLVGGISTLALAGSGVGGVFNLGVSNSVDAQTKLTGAAAGTAQLQVSNTSAGAGSIGVRGNNASTAAALQGENSSGGVGVYGISTNGFGVLAQSSSVSSAAFKAQNSGGGTAGSFVVNAGVAPLKVNSSTKVAGLNADQLDGFDSTQLQRRVSGTCPAGTAVRIVNSDGTVGCQAVGTGAAAWGVATSTGSVAATTSATSFVDLPGATATITVPGPENGLVLARFSAESACYQPGATIGNWCSVQILLDGAPMDPATGVDFAFDSTDAGTETSTSWESHSMDRSLVVGPGNHTVVVQWVVTNGATIFRLDDWSLTIERAPV